MPSSVPVLLLPTLAATFVAIATSAAWVARARATMPGDVEGRTRRLHELFRRRSRLAGLLALVPLFAAMAQGPATPLDRLLAPFVLGSLVCFDLATEPSVRRLHASLRGERWAARPIGLVHGVSMFYTLGIPLAGSLGVLAAQSIGFERDPNAWAFLGYAAGILLARAAVAPWIRRIGTVVPLTGPPLDALRATFPNALPTCHVLRFEGEGLWNAVASGVRRKRRFITHSQDLETLLTPAELHAVLCHEVGHHHLRHLPLRLALSGLAFAVLPGAAALLGGLTPNTAAIFPLLGLVPARRLYRRQERQADAFAARHAPAADLGSALVKITRAHLLPTDQGTATSHPLLRERILALGLPLEMMAVRAGDTPTATVVGASV